ncbi:MAG: MFS transporter [Chloroflexi bacterium]|nr:MFS transporter [Chloroflexota bacterium]
MKYSTARSAFAERIIYYTGLSISMISLIFVIRLVVDTSFRMAYPFIPQISAGLNLSVASFGWLLTIRSTSGLLGPAIGRLADRIGRRNIMGAALLIQFVGMAGMALAKGWWGALPMFLVGVATNAFLPSQQAYISDQVPYERRGRALASVDIAFAISGIVVMPAIGWMMNIWGWRIPFAVLSVLSLIAAVLIWRKLPASETRTRSMAEPQRMGALLRQPNVLASAVVSMLLFAGVGIFMTFWSIWLSADYELDALGLGLTANRIGFAELAGAILTGLFIDRVGKRRGSLISLAIGAIFFGLLPGFSLTLSSSRIMLLLTVLWVEMSIVSLFPLYAEQAPDARATIFSLVALGNAVGLGLGPPLTAALWQWRGLSAVTTVGAISMLLAFGGVWLFLHDQAET